MLLVALLPIIVPLTLLAVFKLSARITMSIAAILTALCAALIWGMQTDAIAASALQGIHRALTVVWILIGAVTLLYTIQDSGAVKSIRQGFMKLSSDMRVQVVIIGFTFLAMIEGVSGFGTPAVIVAPLLITLGFRPIVAASVALISDTVACTFGAGALPLILGLENVTIYSPELISQVANLVTTYDLLIGTVMPLALVYILVVWFGKGSRKDRLKAVAQIAPWSLMVGLTYSLSAFVIVRTVGVEFAAVLAGLISLIVAAVTARVGLLTPKGKPWRNQAKGDKELGEHLLENPVEDDYKPERHMPLWRAWSPYLLVIALLVLSRVIPPATEFLTSCVDLSWLGVLGFDSINSSWQLLYSPGTILLVSAIIGGLIQTRGFKVAGASFLGATKTALGSALALVPTLIMVQIFVNSQLNTSDLASMPIYIGEALGSVTGQAWVVLAPLLGALGAFIAGSTTISTLTLGAVQESIALSADLPVVLILAMQVLGGAAGNVIAVHNVVAVAAVVGLVNQEGYIIRRVVPAVAVYVITAGVLGLITLLLGVL